MDFQNSIGRKQADSTIQLQTCATFQEKGRTVLKVELQAQRVDPQATVFPGLMEYGLDELDFEIVWYW